MRENTCRGLACTGSGRRCRRAARCGQTYPELYKKILRGGFSLPDHLSSGARDLLRNMLVRQIGCVGKAKLFIACC